MPMVKKVFRNEIGNSITIKVKKKNGRGVNHETKQSIKYQGVNVEIIGPTSMSGNEITIMEAKELLSALKQFFKENK